MTTSRQSRSRQSKAWQAFPDIGRDRSDVLTVEEMARADELAIASGISGATLMEGAGRAVADTARDMTAGRDRPLIFVLCGPGNNGGDGFVAARLLEPDARVGLYLLGDHNMLSGDAAAAADAWQQRGPIHDLKVLARQPDILREADLVIDALFGAGLSRPLDGAVATIVDTLNQQQRPVLSIDVPSGVNGSTGEIVGSCAVVADRTVTFFRLKPGHALYPGRGLCGRIVLSDIGIPADLLGPGDAPQTPHAKGTTGARRFVFDADTAARTELIVPADVQLVATPEQHKYTRGHVVVLSGPAHQTGAARLAAMAAQRAGAGLVTVAASGEAIAVNAAHLTSIMITPVEGQDGFANALADKRRNVAVIGPGAGRTPETRAAVLGALAHDHVRVVLDADALSVFEDDPEPLFAACRASAGRVVMTPHEGEFKRLFPDLNADKLSRARTAAQRSGAIIVLKGPDTVVASADGWAGVNTNAPPWLATAGSGDVLAGLVGGLLAQGLAAQKAAATAVWMHGRAGQIAGPGLIAEDLLPAIKTVLEDVHAADHSADEAI